jgi:hypothetical protein
MSDKGRREVAEMRTFKDGENREVIGFYSVLPEKAGGSKPRPVFRGVATVVMKTPDGKQAGAPIRFEFPFKNGVTLEDAFDMFDGEFEKAWGEHQKKMAERGRIVAARMMPKLMGPDGKPVTG